MSELIMDAIDLWHGKLTGGDVIDHDYWQTLDESERQRAMKLNTPYMQARYVEVHGKMRRILAHYLKTEPGRLAIARKKHGKPYLVERPERVFNLSDSADRFVLAVAMDCRLGADIEFCKARTSLNGLVGKCFALEEREYWEALPGHRKTQEFYRFWTRKEAFVKATGRGLGLGLERCVIDPFNPAVMLRVPEKLGPASDWRLADIDLGEGVACAIASDRKFNTITMMEMNDEKGAMF